MTKETIQDLVRHSILTALALDAAGRALGSGYKARSKKSWSLGDRTDYPPHKQDSMLTGKGGYNTEAFCLLYLLLVELRPTQHADTDDFIDEYSLLLIRHRKEQTDTPKGVLAPIAIAIGYYAALNEISIVYLFNLCDYIFGIYGCVEADVEAAILLAFLVSRLCITGYLGIHILEEADRLELLEGSFGDSVHLMMENHLDHRFLSVFRPEWVEDCSYMQIALLNVVFLMLRVDTAYPKELLCSLPREQLPEIFSVKEIKEEDMGFIFGAVCTASEHKHPLVPKPLRESVHHRSLIDSALGSE